jgi:foldase protein PrsA
MIAKEDGRKVRGVLFALALVGLGGPTAALAQGLSIPFGKGSSRAATPAKTQAQAPAQAPQAAAPGQAPTAMPRLELKAIPVNPSDPICIINNEMITRAQLADECVARKGEEILETLIARKLIEQALKRNKLEVTAAEIDQEIDNVAMRVAGLGREAWLRTLDKERGISPVQYARDIIYPALALRKLAAPRVQVTEMDLKKSFEAQYGEKLRCRMIMVDKLQTAREIWEDLRKNPAGFEKLAMDRSMDTGSRSLGGLLAEPISRHAYPETVSGAAFEQLVDGDPKDTDPTHKPKDGDFSGPIQVAEATWVLLRRESVIPARKINGSDPAVKKQTYDLIYDVKLKEAMGQYMVGLMEAAAIDNKLSGKVKLANEQVDADKEVQLMGGRAAAARPAAPADAAPADAPASKPKTPTPAALSPDVAKQAEGLTRPPAAKK